MLHVVGGRITFFLMLWSAFAAAAIGQETAKPPAPVKPTADGILQLDAQAATIHGGRARFMVLEGLGNICYWTDPKEWVSWEVQVDQPGQYVVDLRYSCQAGSQGSTFEVALDGQSLKCSIPEDTGTWYDHETMKLGSLRVAAAGKHTLSLKPQQKPGEAVMNLAWLRLIPAEKYAAYEERTKKERGQKRAEFKGPIYVVPNFHPASCGWLTDFSTERNYCANSYLAHLDRVRDDPNYAFALSECNNLFAILAFAPERVPELKQRIREGRVELVNAFFLEPTINLSGGEALVKMGVEGLRWQQQVFGVRPRVAWTIDVTGVHEQMGQIVSGLGLDAMVYTRDNPTRKTLHWLESPDGSKTLCISPGHYSEWGNLFNTRAPLDQQAIKQLAADAKAKARRTPGGSPVLVLGGGGDYALPPARPDYPKEFLKAWKQAAPDVEVRFTTLSKYLDAVLPEIKSGQIELPTTRSGARLSWTSFWIQCPTVKTWYRRAEHSLQAAEALATIASLNAQYDYPVQPLYHAWLEMLLNMDRNTLWGAAGGMVFEHARSWDVRDRFQSVEAISAKTSGTALLAILGKGESLGLFNPLNWKRNDPVLLHLPEGASLTGTVCQSDADGRAICRLDLPSLGTSSVELQDKPAVSPKAIPLPQTIETAHYRARIDPKTGALASLKLKPSGREMLAGPVLLVAEQGNDFHSTSPRPQRKRLADSARFPPQIKVNEGPLATVVRAESTFYGGGKSVQSIRFYKDYPRIDFDTELADIPDKTVVVAEFPLASSIQEIRRGIPYGFSHGAWATPNPQLPGWAQGIQAAIRWSHYQFAGGGGVAILDRGLPGRELNDQTPVLFLLNAQALYMGYPCAWLSGQGNHRFSYALVAHDGDWKDARIPQMAWEFNSPPFAVASAAKAAPRSFVQTSGSVIVEAMRREAGQIELRLAECLGLAGEATVTVSLPHKEAALTDLVGASAKPLDGGPQYRFPVRPQQIVTMRLRTDQAVQPIEPLLKWDELVPKEKLPALRTYLKGRKGHPPAGDATPRPTLPPDAAKSLTLGKKATASNVYGNLPGSAPELAVDGDENTRWASDAGLHQATLEVDLGEPRPIGRAYLSEAYDRIQEFELQCQREGQWQTFARGGKIGLNLEMKFAPVKARVVRLNVINATDGPTIWEFQLFEPQK